MKTNQGQGSPATRKGITMTTKDERKQRDRKIVTMAMEGTGHAVIADSVGISQSTVSYICRKHGLHFRPRENSARGQKRNDEIRSLVSAGVDTKKIAARFGLSRSRITQICIAGGLRRRRKRTRANGDNSFGSRTAESFPGMGDIAQIDHDRAERMLEAWQCGDTTRLEASDGILLAFANHREVEAGPAPEPPAPEPPAPAPPAPETQGEHPEARRWRLQLCEEQGRRFKLERESKGLRGALASTLGRLERLEGAIIEHRAECTDRGCFCGCVEVFE